MNLKIYKNEKILSRNKTDQVRVWYNKHLLQGARGITKSDSY